MFKSTSAISTNIQAPPGAVCLITGGTESVGRATATELASRGFTIVIAARNLAKAKTVKAAIETTTGASVDVMSTDLTSLSAVCRLADTFNARYPRLDVLINNAGIFAPRRVLTADGFDVGKRLLLLQDQGGDRRSNCRRPFG